MKIMFMVSSLGAGGAERVAATLVNNWSARGDHVELVLTYSKPSKLMYHISSGVRVHQLAELASGSHPAVMAPFVRIRALRRLIQDAKPDVIVSFLPNVNVLTLLAATGLAVPVIISERSDPGAQPLSLFWRLACRLSYRHANALVVQTEAVSKKIHQFFPRLKRVKVLPNPVPEALFQQAIVPAKAGQHILLSIGRLAEEKQVSLIIEAFCQVADQFPHWDLHIHGDGPLRNALEDQARSAGFLGGRIIFFGHTSRPWDVMSAADAFVMASKYEGFPNALVEAMGMGLPSIANDCPSGPREISNDGQVAALISVGMDGQLRDALVKIMDSPETRRHLGELGRQSIRERYSAAVVLRGWDELFKSVLADR